MEGIQRGTTSLTVPFRFVDANGIPKTGLVFNTSGLACVYLRELDAAVTTITLATMTLGTWATGGFVEQSAGSAPGSYSLGVPNAAISAADASKWVEICFIGTNVYAQPLRIDLVAVNPQDAVRFGLTALPNANAGATGGLSDLAILGGTASAGGANTITLTGGSATDNQYKYAIVQITGGAGAGQSRLIIDYAGSTKVATVQKNWSTNPDNTSVFVVRPFAVPAVVHSGVAQAGAASTITLQSIASATDNVYNDLTITIFSGTGAFQSRIIKNYVGSTKIATLDKAWTTNPDNTSVYEIAALGPASDSTAVTEINADVDELIVSVAAIPTNPLLTTDARLNDLDATISSRLPTASYTAPDNSSISAIHTDTGTIISNQSTINGNILAIPAAVWAFVNRTLTSGSSPTVQQIVNGVWDEALSLHVLAASFGAAINSILTKLTAGPVTNLSPSNATGTVQEFIRGQAYDGSENLPISWVSPFPALNYVSATATFFAASGTGVFTKPGTISTVGGVTTVSFNLAGTDTAQFIPGLFSAWVTLANGHPICIAQGTQVIVITEGH